MIAEGLSHDLLIAGMVILACSFLVSTRGLSPIAAILVSLLKVAVPVAYFGWVDDGRWYLLDDETYLQNGLALQDAGLSPWTIFFTHGGRIALETVRGGSHL